MAADPAGPGHDGPAFERGIVPSMNTPFLADGGIDLSSVARTVEHVIGAGVGGMLVLAVAGETGSLTLDEKRELASAYVRQTAGRVPVIVGCSSTQQADRVALAAMACELGAPAMLCQAPDGLRGPALVAAMRELAEVGPPILMLQDLDIAGPGLPLDDILLLRRDLPAFQCLKIETQLPGPKYSAVLGATCGQLHVSGGWAAAQMMEALHRGVHAFIPTAMDPIYVEVVRRFDAGNVEGARALHAKLAPVLAFSNQQIGVSIRFLKQLRHAEGLFSSAVCRAGVPEFDPHQQRECDVQVAHVLALQRELAAG